jgi:hypothetical protein
MLPRGRELSLEHAQRCIFLITEQCCGPQSLEIFPQKHCYFCTSLAKGARALSGACAEGQFPDYGTVLWSPGSRNGSRKSGKHSDFSTYIAKSARTQSGACAEVHFPDFRTVLLSPGSRNCSRKAQLFQHLSCQEREVSLAHAQRCSFLIIEQCCGLLAVELFPGKHCFFSTYFAKCSRA